MCVTMCNLVGFHCNCRAPLIMIRKQDSRRPSLRGDRFTELVRKHGASNGRRGNLVAILLRTYLSPYYSSALDCFTNRYLFCIFALEPWNGLFRNDGLRGSRLWLAVTLHR